LAYWAAAWLGRPVAERGEWVTWEEEESRPWGEASAKERGKGKLRASLASGPKDRNGEEIPLSFYLKCFSNAFSNSFKAI